MNPIAIKDKLLERFHLPARETHRSEAEIINEASSNYLDRDTLYVEVLRQRLEAANRGEFASAQRFFLSFTCWVSLDAREPSQQAAQVATMSWPGRLGTAPHVPDLPYRMALCWGYPLIA